tara:strand:- start:1744 stop:2355 length:612 start_codon:yes stop_codon:yes gene_type:complete
MDLVIELVTTFWQWAILAVLVVIGYIISLNDGQGEERVGFTYKNMPKMSPMPIETKDKGFFKGVWMWLMGSRHWEIVEDWHYELGDAKFVVPKGFQFDGASVPKFLATFLSPVGVLLMGGLVHDYAYKYAGLKTAGTKKEQKLEWELDQKMSDELFRDICIEVNGFKVLNYLAYYSLRLAGFVAWNGHRDRDQFDLKGKRIVP